MAEQFEALLLKLHVDEGIPIEILATAALQSAIHMAQRQSTLNDIAAWLEEIAKLLRSKANEPPVLDGLPS